MFIYSVQDTVRQASLSHLRYEWGPNGPPELHVSRKHIADLLCVGVEKTVASWRNLGIGGSARYSLRTAEKSRSTDQNVGCFEASYVV